MLSIRTNVAERRTFSITPRLTLPEGVWIHRGDYTLATLPDPSSLAIGDTLHLTESGYAHGAARDSGDILLVIVSGSTHIYRCVGFQTLRGGAY